MADVDLSTRIRARFEELGLDLAEGQIDQLSSYFGLLTKWNRTVNLTAVALEPPSDAAIDRILVEPILAAKHLGRADGLMVDLGSGGGSPAIPLKTALPALKLLMIESRTRKAAFLREASRLLELRDVEVFNGRIEEATSRPDLHKTASLVSVRAVRADSELWDSVGAFLAPEGRVLWFRSASDDQGKDLAPLALVATHPLGATSELAVLLRTEDPELAEPAEKD